MSTSLNLSSSQDDSFENLAASSPKAAMPLIENLVTEGEIILVLGPSKSGKTSFKNHLSRQFSTGGFLWSKRVEQAKTLIYDALRQEDFCSRQMMNSDTPEISQASRRPQSEEPSPLLRLEYTLKAIKDHVLENDFKVLVVDNLSWLISDRSRVQTQILLSSCKELASHGVTIFLVQHTSNAKFDPVNPLGAVAGHSTLVRWVDGIIILNHLVRQYKNRRVFSVCLSLRSMKSSGPILTTINEAGDFELVPKEVALDD
ncbi:MAG: hypothetical protein RL095_252 [Verrucomicrobiota bacterium]|jgi:KaiC/GvpD/RAD55 family RecA-like ATPase